MEVEFKNEKNKDLSFHILLDLPINTIKDHIWFKTLSILEPEKSFKYQPKYINFKIEHKKKFYFVEKNNKVIQKDKKKGIYIENKLLDKDSYWINGEKYNKDMKFKSDPYKPVYIVDFLDIKDFDIKDCKFYFESIVDYIVTNNSDFKNTKDIWYGISENDYEDIKEYINRGKIGTYRTFIEMNKKYNLDIEKFYNILYDEKYSFKEFKEKKESSVINIRILVKNLNLSRGDDGNPYIDLYNLFKFFSTDTENFPFLALKHNNHNKIKLDTGFSDKELIKNWSWNTKKISEIDESTELISPKGLLIKVKSDNEYIDLYIIEDGKIYVKFLKPFDMKNFEKSKGYKNIEKAIKYINSDLKDVFINFPSCICLNSLSSNNMNIQVDMKYHMLYSDFEYFSSYSNKLLIDLYLSEFTETMDTTDDSIGLVSKTANFNQSKRSSYGQGNRLFKFPLYDDFISTIRRNTKYDDGSLINIDNINSINKFCLFLSQLNYIWFIFSKNRKNVSENFTKKENKNKNIKKNIDDFDPRDCQIFRQLTISDTKKPLEGSYDLIVNGVRFISLNPDYPYPGYTVNGNPCGFKKDQRKNEKFKNMIEKNNNFSVRPSNIVYSENGNKYQTILYGEKVYYLNKKKMYPVPFNLNKQILDEERELKDKTFFLPPVPFHRVISLPPERLDKVIREDKDGNFVCKNGMSLGFNSKGFPFCFSSKPEVKISNKMKVNTNNHVISTDKILPINRLGNINDQLSFLFPVLDKYTPFRVGINQNNYSFLNAVEKASKRNELLRQIKAHLDYSVFISLNNGDLASSYNFKISEYRKFLEDDNVYKHHSTLWDICEIALNANIVIIDADNSTFICHERPKAIKEGTRCYFIIKTGLFYEPIIYIDDKGDIKALSLKNNDLLLKAYNFLCRPEIRIPDNIKYQILDLQDKSKIKYFVLDTGLIYPVTEKMGPILKQNTRETRKSRKSLNNIPVKSISKRKPTAERMYMLAKQENLCIKEQIVEKINGKNFAIALLTKDDYVIPTRKSELVPNLPIAKNLLYFPNADKKFKSKEAIDERKKFIQEKVSFEKKYHNVKFNVSKYINEKKYSSKNPEIYLEKFLDTYENEFIKKNKEYILGRLTYEIKKNPLIKEGKIPKAYKEEYNPENQIIITESRKLIDYIDNINEQ